MQAGFGYQQQLVPGMRPGGGPMPSYFVPMVQQGQQGQRPGGRRGGPGQQPPQQVPMMQQQVFFHAVLLMIDIIILIFRIEVLTRKFMFLLRCFQGNAFIATLLVAATFKMPLCKTLVEE